MRHIYHVTLRRVHRTHGIPHMLVELSVKTSFPISAMDIIANVEQRWRAPWQVIGIERTI